jgi:hypothetical protein
MSNNLIKRNNLTNRKTTENEQLKGKDTASSLKGMLMADAIDRMFGKDDETVPEKSKKPRIILALSNHGRSPGWDYAKVLQRKMYEAAARSGLEMKFAFFGPDDARGVRRCRITSRWISDPDDMANVMGRAECTCGCYVNIRDVLGQAVKENQDRPMRAVIVVGDAFHDDQDGLDEAAISANQLRRAGTKLFLIQQGDDPATARKLKHLAKISGGAYFRFDPRTQERQLAEMLETVSTFAAGGEEAVKAKGGHAASLLLEHLKQEPMPIIERVEGVKTKVER